MHFSANGRSTNDRPNILLIILDAARARNLSCYGYHRSTTPNLDRFAEQCVVYEQAISPAGWSLPAHASIFTGLYPSKHGAHDQHKYLDPEYPTMAELLRSQGYRTVAFCHNQYVGSLTGLDRGFEYFNRDFNGTPRVARKYLNRVDQGLAKALGYQDSGARQINRQIKWAFNWLQTGKNPFFIFVNFLEPHSPYRSPRQFSTQYLPDDISLQQARQVNHNPWEYLVHSESMNKRDFEVLEALHDSAITYLDARIMEILNWLKQSNQLDRTMIIVTADHGESFGEHQLMGHGHGLYDTLLHVPLIIHYPTGLIKPGRVSHQVQTLDLLPTILEMLGDTSSSVSRSLQGCSLLSNQRHAFTIAEQSRPDLNPFYRRFPGVDVSHYDRALQMIRTERFKFIWSSDGRYELYDWRADPAEEQNLVADCPEVTADLSRQLDEWRHSFVVAVPSTEVPEFDETVKERLRALGYLE
jgi:arylsulfatase A-like enzyme